MSIWDELTTDREISTRSIDLRCWFKLSISRVLGVKMRQKAPNLKVASQANLISKTRAPEDSSMSRYNDFENPFRSEGEGTLYEFEMKK